MPRDVGTGAAALFSPALRLPAQMSTPTRSNGGPLSAPPPDALWSEPLPRAFARAASDTAASLVSSFGSDVTADPPAFSQIYSAADVDCCLWARPALSDMSPDMTADPVDDGVRTMDGAAEDIAPPPPPPPPPPLVIPGVMSELFAGAGVPLSAADGVLLTPEPPRLAVGGGGFGIPAALEAMEGFDGSAGERMETGDGSGGGDGEGEEIDVSRRDTRHRVFNACHACGAAMHIRANRCKECQEPKGKPMPRKPRRRRDGPAA
jgi:hypothetical protein